MVSVLQKSGAAAKKSPVPFPEKTLSFGKNRSSGQSGKASFALPVSPAGQKKIMNPARYGPDRAEHPVCTRPDFGEKHPLSGQSAFRMIPDDSGTLPRKRENSGKRPCGKEKLPGQTARKSLSDTPGCPSDAFHPASFLPEKPLVLVQGISPYPAASAQTAKPGNRLPVRKNSLPAGRY